MFNWAAIFKIIEMINDTEERKIQIHLMLICGCLHDIAEKLRNDTAKKQIVEVEKRIENLLITSFKNY